MRRTDQVSNRRQRRSTLEYHLISRWSVQSDIESVSAVLLDTENLSSWWSDAFLHVDIHHQGNTNGEGRVFNLVTRGWLPYDLKFQLEVSEVNFPNYFRVVAHGDFEGVGIGRLSQVGVRVIVEYDWRVSVNKPLLKWLSPIVKPMLRTNHFWVMRRGQEGLRRILNVNMETTTRPRLTRFAGFRFAFQSSVGIAKQNE